MCKDFFLRCLAMLNHLQFALIMGLNLMNKYEFIHKEIILMCDNLILRLYDVNLISSEFFSSSKMKSRVIELC